MKRATRWSPDTCGCLLEYEWDDAQSENERTHSYVGVVKRCPDHERLGLAAQGLFDGVLGENRRKNRAVELVRQAKPDVAVENVLWWFDKDRVLQVSVMAPELAATERENAQAECDKAFGKGKAKVL